MTEEELREVFVWAEKRDETLYGWLKHLILLGSGSLSLLVSLQPFHNSNALATLFLKGTWVTLGIGILLASIRLYAAVWLEKQKVKQLVKMRAERPSIDGVSQNAPIVCTPPWYILKAEHASYLSFILSIIFLVTAAILST